MTLFGSAKRFALAQRFGKLAQRAVVREGRIKRLPPLSPWTRTRDLKPLAHEPFRIWWRRR